MEMGTFKEENGAPVLPEAAVEEPEIKDAVEFARKLLKFEPDERQAAVLQSEAKRGILNCTRQWGKSTVAATKALYRAYTRPNSLVLVASPSERQSGEFMRKAAEMVALLGIRPRGDGDNKISLLLPNKSRIVGLPGVEGTGRGFSKVSMLLIDEASRVDDEIFKMLRPTIAVGGGDMWLMSTPYGKRGFFYSIWEHGGPGWERVCVPATECPRIEKAYLEEERTHHGVLGFAQEYLCSFVDNGANVFGRDVVERAFDDSVAALKIGPKK